MIPTFPRPTGRNSCAMRGPNVTIHLVRFACIDQSPWPKIRGAPPASPWVRRGSPGWPRKRGVRKRPSGAASQQNLGVLPRIPSPYSTIPKERIPKQSKTESTTDCKTGSNIAKYCILMYFEHIQKDRTSIKLFPHKFVIQFQSIPIEGSFWGAADPTISHLGACWYHELFLEVSNAGKIH